MTDFAMNMTTVVFLLTGVVALLLFVFVGVRYLDQIEGVLSRSKFVSGNKSLYSSAGLIGKIMRICTVSVLLSMPRIFARKGLVEIEQITKLPGFLRGFLVLNWWILFVSGVAFLCFSSF